MSIEEIIRAWKADEEALEPHLPESPVGQELSEEELQEAVGGDCCLGTFTVPCGGSCGTCSVTHQPLQP
jgi:mersacidin/lichenicidin family type 2 lantibiotic